MNFQVIGDTLFPIAPPNEVESAVSRVAGTLRTAAFGSFERIAIVVILAGVVYFTVRSKRSRREQCDILKPA